MSQYTHTDTYMYHMAANIVAQIRSRCESKKSPSADLTVFRLMKSMNAHEFWGLLMKPMNAHEIYEWLITLFMKFMNSHGFHELLMQIKCAHEIHAEAMRPAAVFPGLAAFFAGLAAFFFFPGKRFVRTLLNNRFSAALPLYIPRTKNRNPCRSA